MTAPALSEAGRPGQPIKSSGKSPRRSIELQKRHNAGRKGEPLRTRPPLSVPSTLETALSNRVRELLREYRRRLLLTRPATTAELAAAPKPKLVPRLPEMKPHVPASNHQLRASHL
jgi:hypothetical protein